MEVVIDVVGSYWRTTLPYAAAICLTLDHKGKLNKLQTWRSSDKSFRNCAYLLGIIEKRRVVEGPLWVVLYQCALRPSQAAIS